MKMQSLYLDIATGLPAEGQDTYMAPTNGRTSNYVLNPGINGALVGVWYSFHSGLEEIGAFSLIDTIPYRAAKDAGIFDSPEAEAMYPEEIDSLFILRLTGAQGAPDGVKMQIKANVLYEEAPPEE